MDLVAKIDKYLNESKITPKAMDMIASDFFDEMGDSTGWDGPEAKAIKAFKRDLKDSAEGIWYGNDAMIALVLNNLDYIAKELYKMYKDSPGYGEDE